MTLTPQRRAAVHQYRYDARYEGRMWHDFRSCRSGDHEYHDEWGVTLETRLMNRLIDWKLRSPATAKKMKTSAITEEVHLIRQFTMELRVNYADNEKNETMRKAWAQAARHVNAVANLLADGVKPEIAIFSDDWFAGKEEIALMQDVIQQGLDETVGGGETENVSSELMAAVRDSA